MSELEGLKERLRDAVKCVGAVAPGMPNEPQEALDVIVELEREVERLREEYAYLRDDRIAELERELADERSEIERMLREYAAIINELGRPNKGFSACFETAADLVAARGESDE